MSTAFRIPRGSSAQLLFVEMLRRKASCDGQVWDTWPTAPASERLTLRLDPSQAPGPHTDDTCVTGSLVFQKRAWLGHSLSLRTPMRAPEKLPLGNAVSGWTRQWGPAGHRQRARKDRDEDGLRRERGESANGNIHNADHSASSILGLIKKNNTHKKPARWRWTEGAGALMTKTEPQVRHMRTRVW